MSKGRRQRDLLSPFLFVIVANVLGEFVSRTWGLNRGLLDKKGETEAI